MNLLTYILIVALCSASISYTISCAGIFEGLRKVVTKWGRWFEDLIHCPYCLGHYVTLAVLGITFYNNREFFYAITGWVIIDFLIIWFTCVCIMSLLHFVMVRAYKPVAESETFRKLKENIKLADRKSVV